MAAPAAAEVAGLGTDGAEVAGLETDSGGRSPGNGRSRGRRRSQATERTERRSLRDHSAEVFSHGEKRRSKIDMEDNVLSRSGQCWSTGWRAWC